MPNRPDAIFAVPRLAEIYDLLEGKRDDLEPYLAMAAGFGARSALDATLPTGPAANGSSSPPSPTGAGADRIAAAGTTLRSAKNAFDLA